MPNPDFTIAADFPPVSAAEWRAKVELDLAGASFEKKLTTRLYEGVAVAPLYTSEDWPHAADANGIPGEPPFVRGSSDAGQAWEIRQSHGAPSPLETNREILADLEGGVGGIVLKTGSGGLPLAILEELETALAGVQLDAATLTLDAGASFAAPAAMLAALLRKQGIEAKFRGSFGADPLGSLARDGECLAGAVPQALNDLGALAVWTAKHLPQASAALVSSAAYHEAGATATQELALAAATGVEYLRAMIAAGLPAGQSFGQIAFRLNVGTHFFKDIAKLRAARRIWGRIAQAFGEPAAGAMHIHAATGRRALTQRDPWVNLLRGTAGCFAAGLGGAESVEVAPFDARLAKQQALGRRLARNTQIVLQEESHLGRVQDPAGGSWFVESLTDDLAEAGWKLFQEIEGQGGMAAALESGWVAGKLEATWAERRKNLARRKDPVTGVSEFPDIGEKPLAGERDAAYRPETSNRAAESNVHCGSTDFESAVRAAGEGAGLETLATLFGGAPKRTAAALPFHPFAGVFEALRDASDAFLERTGARPKIFLANLGPASHYTARASWSRNFFEAGGFEVVETGGFADGAAAAAGWKASGAPIAAICSSDKIYADKAADAARALKAAGAAQVVLAGNPGEQRDAWTAAGCDVFIHIGCDVEAILRDLLAKEGALS